MCRAGVLSRITGTTRPRTTTWCRIRPAGSRRIQNIRPIPTCRRHRWNRAVRRAQSQRHSQPSPGHGFWSRHTYQDDNGYLILKGPDAQAYAQQYIRWVGGTTSHWAAATWRFLPNDFRLKSLYGVGRDWPISYEDLEPYYYRAEIELGCAGPNGGTDLGSPRSQPYPMDALPLSYNDQRFSAVLNANGFTVVRTGRAEQRALRQPGALLR